MPLQLSGSFYRGQLWIDRDESRSQLDDLMKGVKEIYIRKLRSRPQLISPYFPTRKSGVSLQEPGHDPGKCGSGSKIRQPFA